MFKDAANSVTWDGREPWAESMILMPVPRSHKVSVCPGVELAHRRVSLTR